MSHSIRRYKTDISERSPATHSDESQDSQSTTPTSLFSSPSPSLRQATDLYSKPEYDISPCTTFCARSSTETYSSTVESFEELCEEPDTYDPEYEVPEYREPVDHDLRPSNPSDFADFFPTMNRLCIRHDDTTHDGNMNLRVDTERKRGTIQLFHLKMNDLKKREFSLRRYERSSGREVCHSARKFTTPSSEKRPAITRSVSNAFASIVKPEFKRASSGFSTHSSNSAKKPIKRQDSGYGSNSDDEDDYNEDENPYFPSPSKAKSTIQIPSNTTKLEFSNYAQVLVKRRGAKSSKRYEFEYWGHKYTWKRVVRKDGEGKEVSYHLYQGDNGYAIAHIVPELRSRSQVREEERNGGWVKPCSMWISDKSVLEAVTDVADVIIATGLIALVDDSIKSHFHPSHSTVRPSISRTHTLPIPKFGVDMEYVGPRALVEHMFKRRNSGASAKEREQRPSPLRAHAVTAY